MSIRNYNAFLKEVRRKHGVSHAKSQEVYRRVTKRLGRSARGVDVSRHPRITSEAVKKARPKRGPEKPKTGPGRELRPIKSIAEWRRVYTTDKGTTTERIVSSADYGRGRRGRK